MTMSRVTTYLKNAANEVMFGMKIWKLWSLKQITSLTVRNEFEKWGRLSFGDYIPNVEPFIYILAVEHTELGEMGW